MNGNAEPHSTTMLLCLLIPSDTGEKGGLSATGAGIVPIAVAALTLMAGAALALAKR